MEYIKLEQIMSKQEIERLTGCCGVYFICYKKYLLYCGESFLLIKRFKQHLKIMNDFFDMIPSFNEQELKFVALPDSIKVYERNNKSALKRELMEKERLLIEMNKPITQCYPGKSPKARYDHCINTTDILMHWLLSIFN